MQFVSLPFVLFVGILLAAYYAVPKRWQWIVLLAGSLFFYAFAGWQCLLFIFAATASSYLFAVWLGRMAASEDETVAAHAGEWTKDERKAFRATAKKKRFRVLVLSLVIGFGLLCIPKYTAFTVGNFNAVFGTSLTLPSILLPLGLSFYTFQTTGYLIDVYRGKTAPEKNPARYALFVCYFPQLVEGPISRFSDLEPQFFGEYRAEWRNLAGGFLRVLWGYFKKLVMADTALLAVGTILGEPEKFNGIFVFALILLYSIVIYGDFTGGIDITLGISEMLGLRLRENFDHPFSSTSTKEYWRRWHITLGTWFTDYVFYPLSVCRPMQKFSKWSRAHLGNAVGKRLPVYLATIATWFLTGLWHGAGWNFIVWGLLNCLIILVSQELNPLYEKFHARFPHCLSNPVYRRFMMIRTFLLMGLIRTLDCYRNVPVTFRMWGSMFKSLGASRLLSPDFSLGVSVAGWCLLAVSVLVVWTVSRHSPVDAPLRERVIVRPGVFALCCGALLTAILLFGAWGIGYDAGQFIYGQF